LSKNQEINKKQKILQRILRATAATDPRTTPWRKIVRSRGTGALGSDARIASE
jgi:hypothetical protein